MAVSTLLTQVFVLFLLMGVGYVLSKTGILNQTTSSQMTNVLCYLVFPCVILTSFQREFDSAMLTNLLIMCAITFAAHLIAILIAHSLFNRKSIPNGLERSVLRFGSVYSNCGFMGFPLLEALVGSNGLFYGSAYNSIFALFAWTHGITLYSGKLNKRSVRKILLNPNILVSVIAILLYCFSVKLPQPIALTAKYIAQLNTPLSMIIIGTTMTQISFGKLFFGAKLWAGVAVRNLLVPFCMLFLLHLAGITGELLLSSMILVSAPVAGFTVLFAKLENRDTEFAAKLMTLSTVLSILTMPLAIGAISLLGY
ncbi:MAG: AEC family transporter [Anaerofustis sp.]